MRAAFAVWCVLCSTLYCAVPRVGPKPAAKEGPYHETAEAVNATALRFPGADAAMVKMTQDTLAAAQGPAAAGLCPHYAGDSAKCILLQTAP